MSAPPQVQNGPVSGTDPLSGNDNSPEQHGYTSGFDA